MIKKLSLSFFSFLSFIIVISFWVCFSDAIAPNTHRFERCVTFENVEIGNYKVVVLNNTVSDWKIYEPQARECLKPHYHFWESRQYLVDKLIDVWILTPENIDNYGILLWKLEVNWWYVDNSNNLTYEKKQYKIFKKWKDFKLKLVKVTKSLCNKRKSSGTIRNLSDWSCESEDAVEDDLQQEIYIIEWPKILKNIYVEFFISWLITIIIEVLCLFIIDKLFREKDQISNKKLLLVWILASTITLPLLRFVLPLFFNNYTVYVIFWESLVAFVEVFFVKYWLKISRWKAILASVICNLCSFLIWLFIF